MKVLDINIESNIQRTPKQTVVCSDRGCCPVAVDVNVEPIDPKQKKAAPVSPPDPNARVDIECTTVVGGDGEHPSCKTFKKLQV